MWPKRGLLSIRLIALLLDGEWGVLCVGLPVCLMASSEQLDPGGVSLRLGLMDAVQN
jgi:hypothetical protein